MNIPNYLTYFVLAWKAGVCVEPNVCLLHRPIEELITVAHEAHFRLELWYALALTRYRHTIKRTYIEERFEKHAEFCKMVAQGRRESGTAAFKHRNSAVKNVFDDNADTSSDSDDGVSQDYY